MKLLFASFWVCWIFMIPKMGFGQERAQWKHQGEYILVIHGGAGTILKSSMSPEKEKRYRAVLEAALQAGFKQLQKTGNGLNAVVAAIEVMENSPLFNAGKGAVFTHEGKNELDASIMDGRNLKAGAVAGVTTIKNPIMAARKVMEQSEHVMLVGKGAEIFAQSKGVTMVKPSYFYTEDRWKGLQKAIKADKEKTQLDHSAIPDTGFPDHKFGTVGAVALDPQGNLAAGTSTGGMTNKKFGRIGDAPIVGAGTYANNKTAGISCTGWGEFFMRNLAAYDVSAQIQYAGKSLFEASGTTIQKIGEMGGNGGLIALNPQGNIATPFNTAGMYRAAITRDGVMEVFIYRD